MCGRFAQTLDQHSLAEQLRRDGFNLPPSSSTSKDTTTSQPQPAFHPSTTCFPGTLQCVYLPSSSPTPSPSSPSGTLETLKWGTPITLPGTSTSPSKPKLKTMINTRDDTLLSRKKTTSSRSRRCILPAQGFYEWKDGRPYYITITITISPEGAACGAAPSPSPPKEDEKPLDHTNNNTNNKNNNSPTPTTPTPTKIMYIAALHHPPTNTFTIVTTSSRSSGSTEMQSVHERMPVILDVGRGEAGEWCDEVGEGWRGVLARRRARGDGKAGVINTPLRVVRVKGGEKGGRGWVEEVEGEVGGEKGTGMGIERFFGGGKKEVVKKGVVKEEEEEKSGIGIGIGIGIKREVCDDHDEGIPHGDKPPLPPQPPQASMSGEVEEVDHSATKKKKVKIETNPKTTKEKSPRRGHGSLPASTQKSKITSFFGKKP
ncbi:hypothetical protein DFH27DRAFT_648991 [Peziza echinospora]|nr:hypothetical protein DFH27DRAFT_648991 [Peziza echinospora]